MVLTLADLSSAGQTEFQVTLKLGLTPCLHLTLLQFFLNHRRYLRSDDPSRVGKSPAELLTGEPHAHWLELLGYTRFSRN